MNGKAGAAVILIMFGVFVGIARADLLEWKKMGFEVSKPVPALNSMEDVRKNFASPLVCSGCHHHHYEEWSESFHARSVRNAGFQALYLKYLEYLRKEETKQALGREAGAEELRQCLFCHAPMVQFASDKLVREISESIAGGKWEEIREIQISCVICHTMTPEAKWTGSFGQTGIMHGPIRDPAPVTASGHESGYSLLHERSEFCGMCHSWKQFNVYCSLVFEQWQGVKGAKQCQECHMESSGEKTIAIGGKERPDHSHLFPGARSGETMAGALRPSLEVEKTQQELFIRVAMESMVPHNVPDG